MQISMNGDILDGVLVRERLCSLSFVASENLKGFRNTKTNLVTYKECEAICQNREGSAFYFYYM